MQAPFNSQLSALIVAASNAPVYTRRSLLGVDGPQTPGASAQPRPMHKPPVASAGLSILGREGTPGGPPLGERTTAEAVPPPACGWWVSALFERVGKENGAPRSSPDAPASVPSCWLITAFPACVILPQMNHQPMCIWMVKPPFTQCISHHVFETTVWIIDGKDLRVRVCCVL